MPTAQLIRAAQYVRMSTDLQAYSTANQQAAIAAYALTHGFQIVRTYADEGRSGLTVKGRSAIKAMLADVLSDDPGFAAILVYDVSRWGRFQDVDESAHYEFLCRSAGVPVHYCAEPFANDGSLPAAIMKSLKRAMAGEFSRELSVKVYEGQARLARRGFKMGGSRRFGFDRMLVDQEGKPKGILQPGQQKHLRTDHVILVPGPSEEVATVRRIFRLSAWSGLTCRDIARRLNADGVVNINGAPWTGVGVGQILRSEIYSGTMIFGRYSKKLGGRQVANDPATWIRCDDVIEPLIDKRTFRAARKGMAARQWRKSDEELLDLLRGLYQRLGRLSVRDVLKQPNFPMPTTYLLRFGSFTRACALAGYVRPKIAYASIYPSLLHRALSLLEDACAAIQNAGGRIEALGETALRVDSVCTVGVTMVRPVTYKRMSWRVRLLERNSIDFLLVGLLDRFEGVAPGFALLPASRFSSSRDVYISQSRPNAPNNRFANLAELYSLLRRLGG